jgi:hypothetical protein
MVSKVIVDSSSRLELTMDSARNVVTMCPNNDLGSPTVATMCSNNDLGSPTVATMCSNNDLSSPTVATCVLTMIPSQAVAKKREKL